MLYCNEMKEHAITAQILGLIAGRSLSEAREILDGAVYLLEKEERHATKQVLQSSTFVPRETARRFDDAIRNLFNDSMEFAEKLMDYPSSRLQSDSDQDDVYLISRPSDEVHPENKNKPE